MIYFVRSNGIAVQDDRLGHFSDEIEDSVAGVRDDRKIRPYRAVEEMLLDRLYYRRNTEEGNLVMLFPYNDVIGKERNASYVVKMRVGDKDIAYFQLGLFIESAGKAPRVKEDFFIQKKTGAL
jgi:hypothetical protein